MFDSAKDEKIEKLLKKVKDLETSLDASTKDAISYENVISEFKKIIEANEYDLNNAKMNYDNIIRNTVAQHEIELSRIKNSEDVAISKATSKIKDETVSLYNQVSILSTKVEMYEKAFAGLGFDVKDMREILNKLVDGIVQKNSINIVK